MRISSLPNLFVAAVLSLCVLLASSAPVDSPSQKTGATLVSTNFGSTTAKGMWFVEFYSPYCSHCKAFAPTWAMIVDMHGHLADSSDFHFARVDCVAQGDLCGEQKIEGYPTMQLYTDGKKLESYSGDRTYELLSTYILTHAKDYRDLKAT